MTLAVRSALMEHVKSTIVTTAVLVMGLVTAAQILHPRDPDLETRRGRPAVAVDMNADRTTTWTNPPARQSQVAMTATADASVAQTLRPASFTLLPVEMTASPSIAEAATQLRRTRRAEPSSGARLVRAASRNRSASIEPGARNEPPAARQDGAKVQPNSAAQGSPIGDLLRGLGIGRDSEG